MNKIIPEINTRSKEWIEIRVWATEQVKNIQESILGKDMSERETDFLRGQASAFKKLLGLEDRIERRSSQAS